MRRSKLGMLPSRSFRAVAGLVACSLLCAAARRPSGDDAAPPPADPTESLRELHLAAVSDTRLRLRSMLDSRVAEEAAVDRRSLVSRKLAVDSALMPAVFLLEIAGSGRAEPLSMLRVDYDHHELLLRGPDEPTVAAIALLGAAWQEALGRGVGFEYRTQRTGAAEDDFPALIHWRALAQPNSLQLRAHWFEPFLAQRRLDFPLNPEALRVDFSPDGASVRSPFPSPVASARSFSATPPRLRNPEDLYDLFDSLGLAGFALRAPAQTRLAPGSSASLIDDKVDEGISLPEEIRTVDWIVHEGSARAVAIWQPVAFLRYESPHQLIGEATVNGERVGGGVRRSAASLTWGPAGLHARVLLRDLQPALDEIPGADGLLGTLRVPETVTISSHGQPLAIAEFGRFRLGPASTLSIGDDAEWEAVEAAAQDAIARRNSQFTPASPSGPSASPDYADDEIVGQVDPLVARWRLRANLLSAALAGDARRHDHAIGLLQRRLRQDGLEPRWAVMNAQAWFEELAGPLDRPEEAFALAAPAWLALAGALDPGEQLAETARLIVAGRWGLALLLARSLEPASLPPGGREWIAQLIRTIEPWARREPPSPPRPGPHAAWDEPTDAVIRRLLDAEVVP